MNPVVSPSDFDISFGTSGVRGLVDELTNEVCYCFTSVFSEVVGISTSAKVVIGHDLRPSSPRIARACIAALQDVGAEVIYVGALPTPAIAFYASKLNAAAIVVTGSHIPFDRNGIKFYSIEGEITKEHESAIMEANVELPNTLALADLSDPDTSAKQAYLDRYVSFFGPDAFDGLSIAVYQHSGVGRDLLCELFELLGATTIPLGRSEEFVPIDTEAVSKKDIDQAAKWAEQYDFDMIVSTDGDADRPLIGDEKGNWLRGDIVGALVAKYLEAECVVTPISCNTVVEQCGWFETVKRTRIGSPYVIAEMEAQTSKNIVGYEANGGFLLGSDISGEHSVLKALPTRDAVLPMLALAALATQYNISVSELAALLPERYTHSDRLQAFAQQRSAELLAALASGAVDSAALLAPQSGDFVAEDITDGYRATFANGDIVHLRASGNAPELRCYAESESSARAVSLVESCLARVSLLQ